MGSNKGPADIERLYGLGVEVVLSDPEALLPTLDRLSARAAVSPATAS